MILLAQKLSIVFQRRNTLCRESLSGPLDFGRNGFLLQQEGRMSKIWPKWLEALGALL